MKLPKLLAGHCIGAIASFGRLAFALHRQSDKNDGCDKPVAHTSDVCKAGFFGVIAKNLADFADRGVDPVLSVVKNFAVPQAACISARVTSWLLSTPTGSAVPLACVRA